MMNHVINKAKTYFALTLLVFLMTFSANAMQDSTEKMLYAGMDYEKVFDQQKVLSKYPNVLKQEGLEVVEVTSEEKDQESTLKNIGHKLTCNFFREKKNTYEQIKKDDDLENNSHEVIIQIEEEEEETTSEKLDQALVDNYLTKKTSAMKRTLKQPLFSMLVDGSMPTMGACLISNEMASGFARLWILNVLGENLKQFSKAFYNIYISPLGDPLAQYEVLYAKRKRFLPCALQEAIENKFGVARKSDFALDSVTKFFSIALNLPLKSKQLKPLSDSAEKVEELLSGYDKKIADIIKLKFFNHYVRFSNQSIPLETPKTILYLQGPPGVGKTHITEQIAELMNAPLIKLTAVENAESIIGTENSPGSLLEAISRPEVSRNAIILIDEVNHVVNKENSSLQLFLPLLEPDAKYFYSPYLKANVDISHFCFVLAGNSEIKDEALRSRLTAIVFKDLSKEAKIKIIGKMLSEKAKNNENLMKEIKQLIENDKDEGVRKLRTAVNDLINQYDMGKKLDFKNEEKNEIINIDDNNN